MKQKTAIDWLIEQLMYESTEMYNHIKDNPETIEKAKSMFREQIEEAVNEGQIYNDGFVYKDGADYYQQKYGDEK